MVCKSHSTEKLFSCLISAQLLALRMGFPVFHSILFLIFRCKGFLNISNWSFLLERFISLHLFLPVIFFFLFFWNYFLCVFQFLRSSLNLWSLVVRLYLNKTLKSLLVALFAWIGFSDWFCIMVSACGAFGVFKCYHVEVCCPWLISCLREETIFLSTD